MSENIVCKTAVVANITEISTKQLCEFSDKQILRLSGRPQPFLEYSPETLYELVESIKEHGIINPVTVREAKNGKYEILSGRNRVRAAKKLGIRSVPAIIKENISDDEAALIMLDSNLRQRHSLRYSEKAYAYRMQTEILNRQGKRSDLEQTLCNSCTKVDTLREAGEKNKESRRTVAYLIRLTYLLPALLEKVDDGTVKLMPAVSMSYLSVSTQSYILKNIIGKHRISKQQVEELRKLEKKGSINGNQIESVFKKDKATEQYTFSLDRKYFKEYPELFKDKAKLQKLFADFLKGYSERQAI